MQAGSRLMSLSTAPPAQGSQAVMRTLYLLVQQLAADTHKFSQKGDHERHDWCRVQLVSTAILMLETSLTAKRALLGNYQPVASCDSLVIFCTVVQPFLF